MECYNLGLYRVLGAAANCSPGYDPVLADRLLHALAIAGLCWIALIVFCAGWTSAGDYVSMHYCLAGACSAMLFSGAYDAILLKDYGLDAVLTNLHYLAQESSDYVEHGSIVVWMMAVVAVLLPFVAFYVAAFAALVTCQPVEPRLRDQTRTPAKLASRT
jgi:hypothetical protein